MTYEQKTKEQLFNSFSKLVPTKSRVSLQPDDSTRQLLPKDSSFITKDSYDAPSGFRRRLSSFGQTYGKGTMKVSYRKKRFILPYVLIVFLFCVGMIARHFVVRSRRIDFSTQRFSFGSHVANSTCCSRTSSYLPYDLSAIQAHQPFQDLEILERWIADGKIHLRADFSKYTRIDGVTTWVNGTDLRHRTSRIMFGQDEQRSNEERMIVKAIKNAQNNMIESEGIQRSESRFRDLNELQYHVRSTRQSLQDHLGTHHIVSTDFWKGQKISKDIQDDSFGHHRGQIPQWLNMTSPLVALPRSKKSSHFPTPAIRLHHDSQAFIPFHQSTPVEDWKNQRLPTFNSMAIEAVIGLNMPELSQIYFLASDDMFFTHKMTTADFYSPLFGPMMQITHAAYSKGEAMTAPTSELMSMEYSIRLLRNRFGTPGFGYITHVQKSIVQPLMEESRMIWRSEFEEATSRRFRGDGMMANSHILTYAMIIERHREALLWSFLIARIDLDGDGELNKDELNRAIEEIGATSISSIVNVRLPKRTTIDSSFRESASHQVGYPSPKVTTPLFSSFDGYAYAEPSEEFTAESGKQFSDMPISMLPSQINNKVFTTNFCQIKLSFCWPKDDQYRPMMRTEEIFKRFAFTERGCGDCLIMHLVGKSGERGLNAFLPETDLEFPQEAIKASKSKNRHKSVTDAYHLPLTNSFHQTNFSLTKVAIENKIGSPSSTYLHSLPNLRSFAMHLLIRYSYSIGTAPGAFESLQTPEMAKEQLARVREYVNGDMAYLCLNDDIISDAEGMKVQLEEFFEDVWPSNRTRLPFEKLL